MIERASEEARRAKTVYPEAEPGQRRWLIWLEPAAEQTDEQGRLLQLRVGLSYQTDGVNHYKLAGHLSQRTLSGWGYHYYLFEGEAHVASTKMASRGSAVQDMTVWSFPTIIPYNSRLPVVVYTAENLQLAHRVFEVVSDYQQASIG